jgi:peptidoglycan/xylan/chitin deacetylase (PgdA/CDA1 family)
VLPRRALLAAAPAALLCGCNQPAWRSAERPDPAPSDSASPSPTSSPSTEGDDPSPTPDAPSPAKDVNWYLSQMPKFGQAPEPELMTVPPGQSTPWWFRVPTKNKVAFITIDDGGMTRSPVARDFIIRAGIPVTMFLNSPAAASYTDYFKAIQGSGAHVQDHTVTHRNLKGQSYDFQHKEIADCRDRHAELFGESPWLFRPPFGNYDSVTLKAARDCGMQVSFFWTQTVDAGIVRYQTSQKIVKPGDVLLMHFRPALADDLLGALRAIKDSGLTPARLETYLPKPEA